MMGAAVSAGGEASGAGEAGLPQHPQEADSMLAGPAGRGCRQTLGEVHQAPRGVLSGLRSRFLLSFSQTHVGAHAGVCGAEGLYTC